MTTSAASFDEAREQLFGEQPYRYSSNPFNHLATASWKGCDRVVKQLANLPQSYTVNVKQK